MEFQGQVISEKKLKMCIIKGKWEWQKLAFFDKIGFFFWKNGVLSRYGSPHFVLYNEAKKSDTGPRLKKLSQEVLLCKTKCFDFGCFPLKL